MNRRSYLSLIIGLALILQSCNSHNTNNSYLGQKPPGTLPELFAPSIVNTDEIEINTVFNSSLTEVFFTRIIDESFVIHHAELINGSWTAPQPIQMYSDRDSKSVAIDPSTTRDGNTMYFLGINPEDYSNDNKPDIYRSHKIEGQWQTASKVEYPVSTDEYAESYPVVVADGSLYFQSDRPGGFGKRDTYRAQYLGDGKFDTPVNLGSEVNSEESARSTYVSPDEKFLITSGTYSEEKGFYISFKVNDKWQNAVHISFGKPFNEEWSYFCPYMSPDGRYFFFSRRYSNPPGGGWKEVTKGEVYWVNVDSIFNRRNE